jgi:hypothetical protein
MITKPDGTVLIEDADQCMSCEHYCKGVTCPLLEALGTGVVSLTDEEMTVDNCGFYVEFKRHLRVI